MSWRGQWRHSVMGLSLSLSCSHLSLSFLFFFSFFPSFLAFPFGFGVLLTTRFSSSSFLFYTHTHTHTHTYIYIYKVFIGSWKLLGWSIRIGMVKVRGAQAKNQGGPSLFLKILHTKIFFFFGDPGGAWAPFALYLGPSLLSDQLQHITRSKVSLSREVFEPCSPSHHSHDVSCTFIITCKITREPWTNHNNLDDNPVM